MMEHSLSQNTLHIITLQHDWNSVEGICLFFFSVSSNKSTWKLDMIGTVYSVLYTDQHKTSTQRVVCHSVDFISFSSYFLFLYFYFHFLFCIDNIATIRVYML